MSRSRSSPFETTSLLPRRSESDALDAEIDRLAAADPSLKIERLERVAEVRTGRSYPTQLTTVRQDAPDAAAGLIRVGDVKDTVDARDAVGEVTKDAWIAEALKPCVFLTGDGMARLDEREILRPLDIVVTTSGGRRKGRLLSGPGRPASIWRTCRRHPGA